MGLRTEPIDTGHADSRRPRFGGPMTPEKMSSRKSVTVLVVDDDPDNLEALSMVMDMLGHDVRTAGNGHEGLEAYLAGNVDLVISDLHMPQMSGLEMLIAIRKASPDAKVIIASAGADETEKMLLRQAGASAIIRKPFEVSELESAIAMALGK